MGVSQAREGSSLSKRQNKFSEMHNWKKDVHCNSQVDKITTMMKETLPRLKFHIVSLEKKVKRR